MAQTRDSSISASDGGPAPGSLRRRVQSGGAVILSGFALGQILRLISNLILTRLVAPEAFGLMAVAVSINIWAVMLTDIGINTSVIRSRNSDNPDFLHTAWTMQIGRNLIVWVTIILAAAAVYALASNQIVRAESVFAHPQLAWVMIAIGIQLPLSGLTSINAAMAERHLAMRRVVGLEVAGQLFAMTITIFFAVLGYGVWALVIGTVAAAAFRSALSHVVFPGPRMALRFTREHFNEIFGFGKWLIIASFFGFLLNRGDQLLFGWLMESGRFSLYAVASIWVVAAVTIVSTVISRIFYPAFSEVLRDRPERLTEIYREVRLISDGAVTAMAFGAFFLAEPIFDRIYPDNYGGVGYYVKLLSLMLLFLPYRLINTAALASGNSKGFTAVTVIGGLAMAAFVPAVFMMFGEKAAIIFFSCVTAASLPVAWRLGGKIMRMDVLTESRMLAAAAILATLLIITE